MHPFWRAAALPCSAGMLIASGLAFAEPTTEHTKVIATGKKPVQLTYHASATNCVASEPPAIKIIEAPKDGALIVRSGALTTDKFAGCGRIRVPAQVVFYEAKDGYVGPDHVTYEAITSNGEVTRYDVSITVQPNPQPPGRSKDSRTPL